MVLSDCEMIEAECIFLLIDNGIMYGIYGNYISYEL